MIRTYYIYALVNPADNRHFYVGLSIDPANRMANHLQTTEGFSVNQAKNDYIRSLANPPKMVILEKINSDKLDAKRLEEKWYWKLRNEGHELLNGINGIGNACDRKSKYSHLIEGL